ncbi:hypothetical protein [Endozoicomonas euniceicola]|uniref:Uncharacterized protein n=1 Tax=Endozoicomonas euniceicola TaxID=1234143 RepID=A0ABY6GNR4_9GAMM|nr:hypothetical protein [Endozoicomonas euniceicola]UYM14310.1 hypothetical protein NX720_15540 [Endozoicomonas euniceicola]
MKIVWLYAALPVVLLLLFSSPNSDANDDNVHFSWTLKTNTGSDEESSQQGSFQCTRTDLSSNREISESGNCCACQPNYYKTFTSVLKIRFNGRPPAAATASATNAIDPLLGIWLLSGNSQRALFPATTTHGLASESCCTNAIDGDCCRYVFFNANPCCSYERFCYMSSYESYDGNACEDLACFFGSFLVNPVIGWTACCPCTLCCCIGGSLKHCSEESARRRNDIDQSTPSDCVGDTRVNHVSVTDSNTATAVASHSSTPRIPQVIHIFRNSPETRSWLTQIIHGARTGTETIIIPGFLDSSVDVDTFVRHSEDGNVRLELHLRNRSLPLSHIDIGLSTLPRISIDRISFHGSNTEFTVIRQPDPVVTTQPLTNNTLPASGDITQEATPQDQPALITPPPPSYYSLFPENSHAK